VAQQSGADAVERAGPGQRIGHNVGAVSHDPTRDALHPSRHLGGGTAREGHQQNSLRIGTIDNQVRDTVRQRIGLARSRAGYNEEWRPRNAVLLPHAVLDGPALLRVEGFKVGCRHHRELESQFKERESRSLIPVSFATLLCRPAHCRH
jgi:hypothetical protein